MRPLFADLRSTAVSLVQALLMLTLWSAPAAMAKPQDFDLPAQPVAEALLAFSQQTNLEVLFAPDSLRGIRSTAVQGKHEPLEALAHLLRDTGFTTRRNNRGKLLITAAPLAAGAITGRFLTPTGVGARHVVVRLSDGKHVTTTDPSGSFHFNNVLPGEYQITATGAGHQSLQLSKVVVVAHHELVLETQTLQNSDELTRLEKYVVKGQLGNLRPFGRSRDALPPRSALGNIDLVRTENDALPFTIYDREQITRSGVVSLNEFLQREILEGQASTRPHEQNGNDESYTSGSTNLNLRGYNADETVILVNGRRLPETTMSLGLPPDSPEVNLIPLSLVQQVQVLPASASALYTGNPVGGVINIVLRPDLDATEISTTYTNSTGGYDAPQATIALQHGQGLLGGKLQLRLSATTSTTFPPTESELGYRRSFLDRHPSNQEFLYRATPNIKSVNGTPLLALANATFTSVAPGADGTGGLAAYAGRQGVRSLALFDSPGGLAASNFSSDNPYGREQKREIYFGSLVYDVLPWLQIGLDGTFARTVVHRGYDVIAGNLTMEADSVLNPFKQKIEISLNEIAPQLGQNYSEARLNYDSSVLGILFKLPAEWRLSADVQYAHNVVKYRGLAGADQERWQALVDKAHYNPLRDTQVFGPPSEFYEQVLIYRQARGQFATLGDFNTLDAAVRLANQILALPTGRGALNLGGDYRRTHLAAFTDERRFGDGTLAREPQLWSGRTLRRVSVFGELQAPLIPAKRLPSWLKMIETDVAVRYVAADSSNETNLAPTYGLKVEFSGGVTFRASITTANRLPTPQMSRPVVMPSTGSGPSVNVDDLFDPRRNENYPVRWENAPAPNLLTEESLTQTAGLVLQRGKIHRFRAALDFVDTHKNNEVVWLDAQTLLNAEEYFPDRVQRQAPVPGDTQAAGRADFLLTGPVNVGNRRSQNWTLSGDYAWSQCLNGTLEFYSRFFYFSRYERQVYATSPVIDELNAPDGLAANLLKYRFKFGGAWSNQYYGFGLDGQYYHSRVLPEKEWSAQGGPEINPYWQFDTYFQSDLTRWLPWKNPRYGLRGQVRVNNVFNQEFPKYVNDVSGAGVQPYGDWRGRTYSLSLTAIF